MQNTLSDYRYFDKNLDSINSTVIALAEPRIQKHDQLSINVSSASLNQEQAQVFNLMNAGAGGGGAAGGMMQGYLVDYDGTISMPVIGKVKAEGLTKNALADTLIARLDSYVRNPVVNIRFLTYRVMMMGEVAQRGWVTFMNEKATIVDALGQSGGLTEQGERTNVLLIRTQPGGQMETHRLDLNDAMIYRSPYFQLQQNDIVYVMPNETKLLQYQRANSPLYRDWPIIAGFITSGLAFVTLIVSLVVK